MNPIKKTLLLLVTTLCLTACSTPSPQVTVPAEFKKPASMGQSYIIGCGDVLFISAWKEDALTRQATVLPDGNIIFPLIGEIKAQGKTVDELKRHIEKKVAVFMPGPNITVQVVQPNSMVIYVIGKVNAPGPFPMQENLTVMKALALAKGPNPFADKDKITVFRTVNGKEHTFQFNYDDVSKGHNLNQNIVLERGDLLVVP